MSRLSTIAFMCRKPLECIRYDTDGVELRLMNADGLLNRAKTGVDEGAIATILDQIGSISIWRKFGSELQHATVSLSLSFIESASRRPLNFTSRIVSIARGLCHTDVGAIDRETGTVIAHGKASYILGAHAGGKHGDYTEDPPQHYVEPYQPGQSLMDYLQVETGDGMVELPFNTRHLGARNPDMAHGGAIAAGLIECARSVRQIPQGQLITGMSIEYLKGGLAEHLSFRAEPMQIGRRASTIAVHSTQAGGRKVASALARFMMA